MSVIYLLSGSLTLAHGQVFLPLHPLILDQESPVTLLDAGHEQCPTCHRWIQFNSVIGVGAGKSKTARPAPHTILMYFGTTCVENWDPLPVATLQYDSEVGPGMIMHVIWI